MDQDSPNIISEIALFSFPDWLIPNGWKKCDGSLLKPEEYQLLYTLIGFQFGGDVPKTFALPGPEHLPPIPAGSKGQYFICVDGRFPTLL